MSFRVHCQTCGQSSEPSPDGCPCGEKLYGLDRLHEPSIAERIVSEMVAPKDFPLVKTSLK